VAGAWSTPWWMLIALAAGVSSWTAGFDILYALQDEEFDRAEQLHSVPVVFGRRGALAIARALHVLTIGSLAAVGAAVPVGWLYAAGVLVAATLLLYEHSLVRGDDLSRLDAAFFTMNGVISLTFFGFVLAERLVR
jgi:4-hydroxybenzoate polyprenyltransferase